MLLSEFDYHLPPNLIARFPLPERTSSRLLCLNKTSGELQHRKFIDLLDLLSPNDLLVFNNTKVIPARWHGEKSSGGRIELLIERIVSDNQALAHIKASKSPKKGGLLHMAGNVVLEVLGREGELFALQCLGEMPLLNYLEQHGQIPIPPYLERAAELTDKNRYQTVYAETAGAVAAPTAGLHFDAEFLQKLQSKKIETAFLTLHVGAGTFQPIRTENILEHQMHSEYLTVSEKVCERVNAAKHRGGRIIAVGTTSVRALETAAQSGKIQPFTGDTRLFIYPGYPFRCIDALITNFHLPKSSLLMLVCAFGGYDHVMRAYSQAIANEYRFFSYGDAMFVF